MDTLEFVNHISNIISEDNRIFEFDDSDWNFRFSLNPIDLPFSKVKIFHVYEHNVPNQWREVLKRLAIRFTSQFKDVKIDELHGRYLIAYVIIK